MNDNPTPDRVTAIYDAIDAFQRKHRTGGGLGHAQIRALLAEHLDQTLPAGLVAVPPTTQTALRDRIRRAICEASGFEFDDDGIEPDEYGEHADAVLGVLPPPADRAADRAAAPVKQRADCTELEWAEQERARFERLYTREYSRADTAVRDAEIYQQRLERLGEGYTRERKRADRAEAEAERLRADRASVCICEHTEAQHFEDVCLACDCGDYLTPEAARESITRLVRGAAANRLALSEALNLGTGAPWSAIHERVKELRRLAAETQPSEPPAHSCGNCEGIDPDTCLTNPDRYAEDAPRREPHPTEADLRHALAVAAKFHGQDAAVSGIGQTDTEADHA